MGAAQWQDNAWTQRDSRKFRVVDSSGRTRKWLLRLVGILSVLVVLQILFHTLLVPHWTIRRIEVSGWIPGAERALLEAAGLDGQVFFFSVNQGRVQERLALNPRIRSVSLTRHFPDRLHLAIETRRPLALSLVEVGGSLRRIAFDEEGVVFETQAQGQEYGNLPVLSGLQFGALSEGLRFPRELLPFLRDLEDLKRRFPPLFGMISELQVSRNTHGGYELLLYPLDHRVRIRLGDQLNEQVMRQMLVVLDVLSSEGILETIGELDFRSEQIVYTLVEE